MRNEVFDVLIAGAGIAGLYAALQFSEDTRVLVLSKDTPQVSSSSLAQGGVAAVLDHHDDSFDFHFRDTMTAGQHQNDPEAVEQLIREGPQDVRRIMELGVAFDQDASGQPQKTLEGGHSRRRIVHWHDQTGKQIINILQQQVQRRRNVTIWQNRTLCALSQVQNGFCADVLQGTQCQRVYASFVVLATGGIGRVFRYTTNPVIATGDGIRFAAALGAKMKNLQYIQFHPTAFPEDGECFLISEAVRGEGAYLFNKRRERFLHRYDERLELAPRDVVSRAIILESQKQGSEQFYLDITHRPADFLQKRFPGIYAACKQRGIDMAKDLIPVFPCQHYLMGGIDVDLSGHTTIPRLYAAGECAHTGLHGANRLASNSLPEALVFGRHAAQDIQRCLDAHYAAVTVSQEPPPSLTDGEAVPPGIVEEIQDLMQEACFVIPQPKKLQAAQRRLAEIQQQLSKTPYRMDRARVETESIAAVAALIVKEQIQHDANLSG